MQIPLRNQIDFEDEISRLSDLAQALVMAIRGYDADNEGAKNGMEAIAISISDRLDGLSEAMAKSRKVAA